MIEAIFLLLGSMALFLIVIAGVLRAFGFIANAFPDAWNQFTGKTSQDEK